MSKIESVLYSEFELNPEMAEKGSLPIVIRGQMTTLFRKGSTPREIILEMHRTFCNDCPVKKCSLNPNFPNSIGLIDDNSVPISGHRNVIVTPLFFPVNNMGELRKSIIDANCLVQYRFNLLAQIAYHLKNRHGQNPKSSA